MYCRILSEWEVMDTRGDLTIMQDSSSSSSSLSGSTTDDSTVQPTTNERCMSAYQAVLVKRAGDTQWSTVNIQLVREHDCWLIDRLWIDDRSDSSNGNVQLVEQQSVAALLTDAANEAMGCKFSDYDPQQLVSWLEREPNTSMSPMVRAIHTTQKQNFSQYNLSADSNVVC
jgi:hypothetical protein